MHYGDRIGMLQKIAEREGKLPSALANRAVPSDGAAPYFTAFKRLHSSRILGPDGTPSGIALTEIESYSRMFGFDSLDDRVELVHFVKICDDAWLAEVNKRRTPVGGSGKHSSGRRR